MPCRTGTAPCRRHCRAICHAVVFLLFFQPFTLQGQTGSGDEPPVLLKAEELVHDESTDVVTASGNVELSQSERILLADRVSYDRGTDTVTASGNVRLLEPDGEVIFSDYAVLQDELKSGFVRNLRVLMKDGSRLAANRAERVAGQRKTMEMAVYSPCKPCRDEPDRLPIWQIRASRVIHHEARRDLEYRDAVLEMFGIPVLYTPYLVHPDPSVDRRSGFLTPNFGYSDNLGYIAGLPAFYAIAPDRDLELEPILHSSSGLILRSRYRQALAAGNIDFLATGGLLDRRILNTDQAEIEGSAHLTGRFDYDETWRTGFDYKRASRRTYLRRFDLDTDDVLTSQVFVEGFRGRQHARVGLYKFQGLRSIDAKHRQPTVLPSATYSFVGEPDRFGGRLQFDAAALSLDRSVGTDSRKLSLVSGWQRPYFGPLGDIYTLSATVQSDLYDVRNRSDATSESRTGESVSTARIFPQLGLNWRYPFVRTGEASSQVIEPIINVVAGTDDDNEELIPNEDSQTFEFDDTNIFEMNRFEGTDRVTGGGRVDYGIRASLIDTGSLTSEAFIGQSYRIWGRTALGANSGLSEDMSDYVGRARIAPTDWLDMLVRVRLDKETFRPSRRELDLNFHQNSYDLGFDYVLLGEKLSGKGFGNREQIETNFNVRFLENWSVSGRLVHDLSGSSNRTLRSELGLGYGDECFSFGLQFNRENFVDEDIAPEDKIIFKIKFKNLG